GQTLRGASNAHPDASRRGTITRLGASGPGFLAVGFQGRCDGNRSSCAAIWSGPGLVSLPGAVGYGMVLAVSSSPPAARWRALLPLSVAELLALSLWFSASAVLPALAREWQLGDAGAAALTIAVQLG